MNREKDIEFIDRYISNELSVKERDEFNDRISNDPAFNDLFQFINNLQVVTKVKGREKIRESVNELFKENTVTRPTVIKNPVINISSVKSLFDDFRRKPIYAIAASALILVISSIILVFLIYKPSNTENIIVTREDKELMNKLKVDSLVDQAKSIQSYQLMPENIKSKEFGFVSNDSKKNVPLQIIILNDKRYSMNYILLSDTIVLLGNFNRSDIKKVFNAPRFLIMDYAEKYYRLQKTERKLLPIREETDSALIKAILKPQ